MKTTQERIAELRRRREQARTDPQAAERQHDRGKLTARERVEALDPGSFVELDAFAVHRVSAFGMEAQATGRWRDHRPRHDRRPAGLPVRAGLYRVRRVAGRGVRRKICKVMDLALRMGVPCIGSNDSGGARTGGRRQPGRLCRDLLPQCAGIGRHPQLSLIAGPCAGGAVYSPAMTDFILMVKGSSQMFITGLT